MKRNSEVTIESEFFWIEDSADDLVQAIMAEAGIEGFKYNLVKEELVVLDEQTDFVYFRTEVLRPPGSLSVLEVTSISVWPRSDHRNDGVVFTIELGESPPHERGWESYLSGVYCQLRLPSGDTLLSPAVYRGDHRNLVCILGGGELGGIPEAVELILSHYSGFNQLYFPMHSKASSEIAHVAMGTLTTEEVRYNSTLLEAMLQE